MTPSQPWLKSYPQGVRHSIDPDRFGSLVEMIDWTCERFPTRTAFSNLGNEMTFAQVDRLSLKMAAYYQSVLGLKKGDRIIIQMPNLLQYPIALFGALRAGLVVVNVNPLYTAHEMEQYFVDSGATAIVILENFADKLEQVIAKTPIRHVILTEVGDLFSTPKRVLTNLAVRYVKKMVPAHGLRKYVRFNDALAQGAQGSFTPVAIERGDLAFLQFTGGTTGVSKAAMLSHRNLLSNLSQMIEWMKPRLEEGVETAIAALPLYHVFSLTVNCFGLFHLGSHNVLITNPREIGPFIQTLAKTRPSVMTAISTLLAGLLNHKDFDGLDLSSLKVTVAGGMALKGSVAEEWRRRTQTLVIEGYGLTEASPVLACNPLDGTDRVGTIGLPLPSTEIKLLDDSGNEVPQGEAGELCARGPQVMLGYWNRLDETKKVLDEQGWLHTGDMAVMAPDGFFKIVDRKKDMVLVSGFNVYPNEVEEVVMQHPKVLEAAVIAMPDEHSGEAVRLFVVKRDPSLTEAELKEHCASNLAAYKRPKKIDFRSELPKTNVGKILKRELR